MSLNYTINVIGRIKVITKLQNLAKDLGPVLALLALKSLRDFCLVSSNG